MLLLKSSLTQKERQPLTCVLMTWIVPLTPVFGKAEESLDDAPTQKTELEEGAAVTRAGGVGRAE